MLYIYDGITPRFDRIPSLGVMIRIVSVTYYGIFRLI